MFYVIFITTKRRIKSYIHYVFLFGIINFILGCDNNNTSCEYISDNAELAKGIKAKIYYPCDWKLKHDDRPDVVQYIANSSGRVGLAFQVHDIDPNYAFTKEGVSEAIGYYGKPISIQEVKLNGRNVIESIVETTFEDPKLGFAYSKILAFTFTHNGKGISMNFSTQSLEKSVADKEFEEYQQLFRKIASKATFY